MKAPFLYERHGSTLAALRRRGAWESPGSVEASDLLDLAWHNLARCVEQGGVLVWYPAPSRWQA